MERQSLVNRPRATDYNGALNSTGKTFIRLNRRNDYILLVNTIITYYMFVYNRVHRKNKI